MRDVLVILPLYRNAALVPALFRSLVSAADDFAGIGGRLLIIVDSPDDDELREMLRRELPALEAVVPTVVHVNETNIGFIGSVNFGFARAIAERRDTIILNSDVVVSAGAFREIRDVAYLDHMTGFVCPRSNNATICSLPSDPRYRHRSVEESRASYDLLSPHLPRFRYVPTAVGFCMYIKWTILAEFGCFDPIYGRGYNEENDLVMRASRCGYRAALANHAFVFHIGEQSFSLTSSSTSARDLQNGKIFRKRYPEYDRSIERELQSPEVFAETMLTGFLPDDQGKLTIAFDWSHIGLYHNGTFEAAKAILVAAARRWQSSYNIVVIASAQAAAFHGIDAIAGVSIVARDKAEIYAAIIRVGQPFDADVIDFLVQHSPVVVLYMLDTIALDCQYLDEIGLQDIWQYSLDSTDLVVYISEYTQTQFRLRFRISPTTLELASLLSLDTTDYREGAARPAAGDTVLVVGNHFSHKYVDPTVSLLAASHPHVKVVVLGGSSVRSPSVTVHPSGSLAPDVIDQLYQDARVVLFPSHYEGFGLPVMHAIARRRPVIVRTMPLYDEINARLRGSSNLHQRETIEEMVRLACDPATQWNPEDRSFDGNGEGWDRVAADLESGIDQARERSRYDNLVARYERLQRKGPEANERYRSRKSAAPPELRIFGFVVPRIVLIGTVIIVLALLSTLGVLVSSAFMAFRGYSALPFWDQWQYVGPDAISASFFRFHNEHRAVISKLLFLADAQWFGSRNILLYSAIYLIQAFHCAVLVRLGLGSGIKGRIRSLLVPMTVICTLFATQNYENLTWGFQTQFVLVFAMASASFLCFALFIDRRRPVYLLESLAAALVASFEMANGIGTFPLLMLFALYYRTSWKVLVLIALGMATVVLTYAFGQIVFQSDPTMVQSHVMLVVKYTLVYLGGFLATTVTNSSLGRAMGVTDMATTIRLAFMFGLMLVGFCSWVVLFASRRVRPETVAIACVFAFAAGSAGITALGRAGLGLESALSARYVAGSGLATVAAVFLLLWVLSSAGRAWIQATMLSGVALFLALVALSQPYFIAMADNRRIGRDTATTALYTGVNDEDALRNVFIDANLVRAGASYFRSESASIFADDRYRLLGRKFSGSVAACAVAVTGDTPVVGGGWRITGTAEVNPFVLRPPMIFVLDSDDRIVGLAFASIQIEQSRRIQLKKIVQSVPWIGHVVPGARGPFRAVLSSKADSCMQTAAPR
ncbi:glycosyltransferase [Rhodopseudomonas sp. RCAM05734]|uniref:glycosyltransferase n=1 Tax=Rhodopseudomonas sp. RCAM05734 TaxID=3457549 RepID=UPI0040440C5A